MSEKIKDGDVVEPSVEDDEISNGEGAPEEVEIVDDDGSSDGAADNEQEAELRDPVEQVAELERKVHDLTDRLLRTAAELDNVRKRARRDVQNATVQGRTDVLQALLPVIDAIELALKNADPDGPAVSIVEGVEMVRRQFLSSMEPFSLKQIESVGQGFDPNFHEAVGQIPSTDYPAGQVIDEMRTGYLLGERLIRAAMVIVSQGAPEESEPAEGAVSVDTQAAEAAAEEEDEASAEATESEDADV